VRFVQIGSMSAATISLPSAALRASGLQLMSSVHWQCTLYETSGGDPGIAAVQGEGGLVGSRQRGAHGAESLKGALSRAGLPRDAGTDRQ
jgi:hypothetical protein